MTIEHGCESLLQSLELLIGQGSATRESALELAGARGELDPALQRTFQQLVVRFDQTLRETGEQLALLRQVLNGFPHPAQ